MSRLVFVSFALLGLAACAAPSTDPALSGPTITVLKPQPNPPPPAAAQVAKPNRSKPPAAPAHPPTIPPAATAPPTLPAENAKPAAASFSPERLKGLDEAAARRLLGAPTRQNDRPPARIWVYDAPACRLGLAFYPDVASQTYRVLSYELTPRGAAPLTGADCIGQVIGGRR